MEVKRPEGISRLLYLNMFNLTVNQLVDFFI